VVHSPSKITVLLKLPITTIIILYEVGACIMIFWLVELIGLYFEILIYLHKVRGMYHDILIS
jgi:hypothetical protein